jgi:hypothetical protein
MKHAFKLTPHPRLYLDDKNLRLARSLPWLNQAEANVRKSADEYAGSLQLRYPRNVHNEHLLRAREVQGRVVTLLARFLECGLDKYRDAVLKHVRMMGEWECWSWIKWREANYAPDAIFDLSYGENSATLALAYDLLYNTLSNAEKKLCLDIARRWSFASGMKNARKGGAWWFGKPNHNWNGVCAGGLGLLALAMRDDAPEAGPLLESAEQSIRPFIEYLQGTDGAWPEGIGYWNYGMRYAFMYLLSHEKAFGQVHPLMRVAALRKTMRFPLDFCPGGQPCGFGDSNHWSPLPVHYAMARRLRCGDVTADIDRIMQKDDAAAATRTRWWPDAAEWFLLHPGRVVKHKKSSPFKGTRFYRGVEWGILADKMPLPKIYLSFRGGTTQVPHSHRDLMSFHCIVGKEVLITSPGPVEYLDSTFSRRRDELFEMGPQSKNTILINGLGITPGSALDLTEPLHLPGAVGVRFIATTAMGLTRQNGPAADFCGRVILMLGKRCFLLVDRVIMPHAGRVESRVHSLFPVTLGHGRALIRGRQELLAISCAANVPALLCAATTAPTMPTEKQATVIRWCTENQHKEILLAMLLSPGISSAGLALAKKSGRIIAKVHAAGFRGDLNLSSFLMPA